MSEEERRKLESFLRDVFHHLKSARINWLLGAVVQFGEVVFIVRPDWTMEEAVHSYRYALLLKKQRE